MKTTCSKKNSGSVLLATMFFVLAIAAYLVNYLLLVQNSNQLVARAQRWNAAMPIAEAGIEEGMAKLNIVGISTSSNAISFSTLSHDLNNGTYYVSGSAAGVVSTITSTGMVTAPITGDTIVRAVQVTVQRSALFSKGIVAMTYITLKGNGPIVDSYNSTNGPYDPSATPGTNGGIAALNGIVDLGNHTIDGNAYLGPNSTITSGPNGGVTGTTYKDFNIQFPDAFIPTNDATGNPISWAGAPGGSSSHTFTTPGYYIVNDNGDIAVNPGVTVTLDVRVSNYSPSGLTINGGTTNAGTVIMYQESGSVILGGNNSGGAVNNQPKNFVYFGLPGVTTITYGGGSKFVGVIYAPEADFTMNGGGPANNFIGSLIVKSVTDNGTFNLHYDESLVGYYYGYYVGSSWQEL